MTIYLLNAFTHKMLDNKPHTIQITPTTLDEINKNKKDAMIAIGHRFIAKHLHVKTNRMDIQLEKGDTAYIITSTKTRPKNWYPSPPQEPEWTYKKVQIE